MTTSAETALVVTQVAHPAIRMQLDTGALTINGEDPDCVLREHASLIGHIHASEPDLLPLGDGKALHKNFAEALERFLPDHTVTIEMLATHDEPQTSSVARALSVAIQCYRNDEARGGR